MAEEEFFRVPNFERVLFFQFSSIYVYMRVAFQHRIIFLEKFLEMVLNTIKLQGNRKVKKKLILSHRRKFCNFS